MKRLTWLLIFMFVIAGAGIAHAKSSYMTTFNTTYGISNTVLNTCSVCHTAAPALNPYGTAFKNSGHVYSTIEPLDSDGDGFTTIVEINARTFPGDPASKPASTGGGGAAPHSSLSYTGSAMCLACHQAEANEVHASAHYQWQGAAPYMVNGAPIQGKLHTALNSYCVNILGNFGGCGSCHVGLGALPSATVSQAQLENIDCLICHQKEYKRIKDAASGKYVPDTAKMTITMDQAVQTVHKPNRGTCLQCHARAGGGDNNKRGDIALAHTNTTDRNFDVHMATTGANLTCQACHTTQQHKIAGRGADLRETDLDVKMSCSTATCHPTKLSSTGHVTADVNKHVKKVACQTCHIRTYARDAADTATNESTETVRDWKTPEWSTALNRWEPTIHRANTIKPEYRFWNGTSWGYSLNEVASIDPATGRYPTARPMGGINDAASKLYPFKYKYSIRPYAPGIAKLIALDTKVYFSTGNADAAVKQGLVNMGHSSAEPYTWVEDDTFQLITHEVMPKEQALTCSNCHGSTATQMNLKQMGYVLKGAASSVCSQCHSYKDPARTSFTSLHKKHVTDKKYDCSKCHSFTRSGSTTTPPPTTTNYTVSVSKNGTGSGTVTSSPSGISCGTDCGQAYAQGTIVTLKAAAAAGSTFKGWSGGGCSGTGDCIFTVSANATVTASFDTASTQSGQNIAVKSTAVDYGTVALNTTKEKKIEVKNTGTAPLTVTRVAISGTNASLFSLGSSSTFTVQPGSDYDLKVRFKPATTGRKTATVTVYSNDPDTPALTIAVRGEGVTSR
ncbi:MAG: choice-of-anchor D domain-containing protein [Nitrospirota bacterium]